MYHNFSKLQKPLSYFCGLLLLWCTSFDGFSQNGRVADSLQQELNKREGSARCEVLYKLCVYYYNHDDKKKSLQYVEDGYSLALQFGDSLMIVRGGRTKGQILRRLDRLDEAIEVFNKVIGTARRNQLIPEYREEYKLILNSLAIAYTDEANYDKSLQFHFQSLVIREKDGNKADISITLNNIGIVYFKLRNYDIALEYYKKSLQMKSEAKDTYDLDRLYINIGLCYNQLDNYQEARDYINQGFKVCEPNCRPVIQIEGQFGLGVSYIIEGEVERDSKFFLEAEKYFLQSKTIAKEQGDKRFQLENIVYLANIYTDMHRVEEAKKILEEGELIAKGTEYNRLLIEVYRGFSDLFNQTKDFQKAAFYQHEYIHLKDSIYSEALIKNLAQVQTDFEERENIATIATKEEVIKRQRWLNISIAVIAVLSVLLIFVLYQGNKVKKRVNNALSDAKATIEEKNQQLEAANQNLEATVDARTHEIRVVNESLKRVNDELDNFIYKTSHDIRGPLASLKGMCNVALMDVKDPLALDYLTKLDDTAEKLNTILTRLLIINQINNASPHFELIDFNGIIEDVMMLEKKKGLPTRFSIHKSIESNIEFYSDRELVRIILENLIDNAVKFHNDSDRVEPFANIRVKRNRDLLIISVIDNGIGVSEVNPNKLFQMFSRASERSGTGGIGLYLTRSATEKLGGRVNLKTTPEGYTEFYVEFSLK